jgi:hypothetical protein
VDPIETATQPRQIHFVSDVSACTMQIKIAESAMNPNAK